jgi:hypothetical protein
MPEFIIMGNSIFRTSSIRGIWKKPDGNTFVYIEGVPGVVHVKNVDFGKLKTYFGKFAFSLQETDEITSSGI